LELKPGWDLAKQHIAGVEQQTKLMKAVADYQSALAKKPNEPKILEQLASACYLTGDKQAAIKHWTTLLAIQPESPDTLNNLAYVLSENPKAKWFNTDKALDYARKACKLTDYRNMNYLDTLARAYAAGEDFAKAIKVANQALALANAANQPRAAEQLQNSIKAYQDGRMP
jgi:tetratricopeptide (TPR) repeat protein